MSPTGMTISVCHIGYDSCHNNLENTMLVLGSTRADIGGEVAHWVVPKSRATCVFFTPTETEQGTKRDQYRSPKTLCNVASSVHC